MKYNPLSQVVDEPLQISDETVEKLSAFRQRDPKLPLLPGVDVTDERARLSKIVNDLTDRIVAGIRVHPNKLWVLSEFQKSLELIEEEETEGREHFGLELERIMDILGIESSDGLLAFYLGGI
jgi:hypothetical protein